MGKDESQPKEEIRRLLEECWTPSESIEAEHLHPEVAARRLLAQFKETADCRYFNVFYQLTRGIFFAYALSHVRRYQAPLDAEEVLNRMYILLFEKLLHPTAKVP